MKPYFLIVSFLVITACDSQPRESSGIVENQIEFLEESSQISSISSSISSTKLELEMAGSLSEKLEILSAFAEEFREVPPNDPSKIEALNILIESLVIDGKPGGSHARFITRYIFENNFIDVVLDLQSHELLLEFANLSQFSISSEELLLIGVFEVNGADSLIEEILSRRIFTSDGRLDSQITSLSDLDGNEWVALRVSALNGNEVAINSIILLVDDIQPIQRQSLFEQLKYIDQNEIRNYLIGQVFSDEIIVMDSHSGELREPIAWRAAKAVSWIYQDESFPVEDVSLYVAGSDLELDQIRQWLVQTNKYSPAQN